MDEQAQIRAKKAATEYRGIYWPRTIGSLRQKGWEVGMVTYFWYAKSVCGSLRRREVDVDNGKTSGLKLRGWIEGRNKGTYGGERSVYWHSRQRTGQL
jgi:hypothetical protein